VLSKTHLFDLTIDILKAKKTKENVTEIDKVIEKAENEKKEASKTVGKYKKASENFVQKFIETKPNYDFLVSEKFSKSAFFKLFPDTTEPYTKEELEYALRYARAQFDVGNYPESEKVLGALVNLFEDDEQTINVLFGKVFSEILNDNFAQAHEDIKILKDKVGSEREKATPMVALASRIQLLQATLYLTLKNKVTDDSLELMTDMFSKEYFLNALQLACPFMIRYIISSYLLLKSYAKFDLNKLIALLPYFQPDVAKYQDCLSQFVLALLEDFDFKKAKEILKRFKKELQGDYFLDEHIDKIINNSQTIFFEVFCKIYRKIEIKMVAEFLEKDIEQAEVWIVNLIRNADFEAKVDPSTGVIHLTSQRMTVYERVLNKTRDILPRTNILINNITRILKSQD